MELLKADSIIEYKADSIIEYKADSIIEHKADSIIEYKADSIIEYTRSLFIKQNTINLLCLAGCPGIFDGERLSQTSYKSMGGHH